MHAPVLVTPPATRILSFDDLDKHIRLDGDTDEQSLIESYILAAEAYLDGWTGILGRALITQTWRQDFDGFYRVLRLPLFPVQSVTSVTYEDEAGDTQTVDDGNYQLLRDSLGDYVLFNELYSFPTVQDDGPAVHVTYVAGHGNAADVPEPIRQAMRLMVCDWYESRSSAIYGATATSLPMAVTVDRLVAPWRRVRI